MDASEPVDNSMIDWEHQTRRGFLTAAGASIIGISGCSGFQTSQSDVTTSKNPTKGVSTMPSCETSRASQIIRVVPNGYLATFSSKPAAIDAKQRLLNDSKIQTGDLRVLTEEQGEKVRYSVELQLGAYANLDQFNQAIGDQDSLIDARYGQSHQRAVTVSQDLKQALISSESISNSNVQTRVVTRSSPRPYSAVALLFDIDTAIGTLQNASTFRFETTGGRRSVILANASDIKSLELRKPANADRSLFVQLTESGKTEFVSGLQEAGALDDPSSAEISTFYGKTAIDSAGIRKNLAKVMEEGNWRGGFVVDINSSEREKIATSFFSKTFADNIFVSIITCS